MSYFFINGISYLLYPISYLLPPPDEEALADYQEEVPGDAGPAAGQGRIGSMETCLLSPDPPRLLRRAGPDQVQGGEAGAHTRQGGPG